MHEPLRSGDRRSAAVLDRVEAVGADADPAWFPGDDGALTGIIDWEGACAGDPRFDLVRFAYDLDGHDQPVWDVVEATGIESRVLRAYVAHHALRCTSWQIRHHPEDVPRQLDRAERVLDRYGAYPMAAARLPTSCARAYVGSPGRSRCRRRRPMAKLMYVANVTLDGHIEDADGHFDWTEPTDEYFGFITDLVRPAGTYLYGRRLYETMAVWETDPTLAAQSELRADFAGVWQAADKIVYSTTLRTVATANTRLEPRFDPDAVRDLKASAAGDLTIGGASLAAHAFDAGLVDECHLFVGPVIVGRGKPAFGSAARTELDLLEERRFDNGVVYLRYRTHR